MFNVKAKITVAFMGAFAFGVGFSMIPSTALAGLTGQGLTGGPSGSCVAGGTCSVGTLTATGGLITGTGLALSTTSATNSITSAITAAAATSSVSAFTMTPVNFLYADDRVLHVMAGDAGVAMSVDTEGDMSVAGSVTTSGAVIATGVGSIYIGARHSAGYSAVWGNVTPTATNYMIGSGSAGDTEVNASTGQAIGFNNNNSQIGYMSSTAFKLSVGMTKSRGSIVLASGTGTVTVTAGAICVCSNTTTLLACQASLSSTTLTTTSGVGADTVNYICL